MNKAKFFKSFLVLAILVTWSIPRSGQAVDWFGNSSQEKIKYYEGYNAALAAVTTNALSLPIKTSVSSTDLSNLQKQINILNSKISTLENTTSIDDWGYNDLTTSTDNYVTNPMTEWLDVNNMPIGNYNSSDAIYFDSDINLGAHTLFGKSLNFTTMEDNSILLKSFVRSNDSTAGNFGAVGDNSFGVWSLAEGEVSRAGYFGATGNGAIGIVASGHGEESLAGVFNGPVVIENGNLTVDRIDSGIEAVYFDSDVNLGGGTIFGKNLNFTTMDDNHTLIRSQAFGNNSTAGHFNAFGTNSNAIYARASSTSSYAGWFDGNMIIDNGGELKFNQLGDLTISPTNTGWGGLLVKSGTNVGIIFDANNDDSASAFKVMRDGEDFDSAIPVMDITTDVAAPNNNQVNIYNGKLNVSNYQGSARIRLEGWTPGYEFSNSLADSNNKNWAFMAHENNFYGDVVGDHFSGGYHWLEVIRDDLDVDSVNFPLGKVGVGTSNPNKGLHVYSSSTNAEIDIQTGSNTHWGIYQDNNSGNLNFWHGNNKVSFTDQGLSTNGICLDGQCVNSWKDLKKYLEPKIIVDPDIYPDNPVVR